MKKLDKNKILAASYKTWLDKLEQDNEAHPVYNSRHEFYLDVVANLL